MKNNELPSLPDAEAYLYVNGNQRGVSLYYRSDSEISEGTSRFPLITTDQAEAYAQARVREVLEKAVSICVSVYAQGSAEYTATRNPYFEGGCDAADLIEQRILNLIPKNNHD